jgi:thioesterase domain-containing protein
VAQQLRSQGEAVSLLAVIDSPMPVRWAGMLEDLGAPKERWRLVQERVYAITLNALRVPQLRRLKGVGESHRWALWSYRPRPLEGRILLINPRDDLRVRRSERHWRALAREGVEVALLPGSHGDLMKEPGVALLAERIDAYLGSAFPGIR